MLTTIQEAEFEESLAGSERSSMVSDPDKNSINSNPKENYVGTPEIGVTQND